MKKILLNFLPLIISSVCLTTISCETILDDNNKKPPANEVSNFPGNNNWDSNKKIEINSIMIYAKEDDFVVDIIGENLSPFPDSYELSLFDESANETNVIRPNDVYLERPNLFTLKRVSFRISYDSTYGGKQLIIKAKNNDVEIQKEFPSFQRNSMTNGKIQYPNSLTMEENNGAWEITSNGTIVKFNGTIGNDGSIVIPEYYKFDGMSEMQPITNIAANFFKANTKIKKIVISKNIKSIQNGAFFGCNQLEKVEFPEDSNLEYLGIRAFADTNLKNIVLPKNLLWIDRLVFKDCYSLKLVKISNNTKYFNQKNFPNQKSFEEIATIQKY